jgi:hypothetical protein
VLKALPRGVARGFGDAFRGDLGGIGKATAIVTGLSYTAFGYAAGSLSGRRSARPAPDAAPIGTPAAGPVVSPVAGPVAGTVPETSR